MNRKKGIARKITLTTLSGAIVVSSVPIHVFADISKSRNEGLLSTETPAEELLGSSAQEYSEVKGESEGADNQETYELKESNEEVEVMDNARSEEQEVVENSEEVIETQEISDYLGSLEEVGGGDSEDESHTLNIAQTVSIPDEKLEIVIRDAIGKPTGDITQEDMEKITKLNLSGKGVKNLTGLEHAVNLTYLNYPHNNNNPNLTPISNLPKLEELYLNNNSLKSVSALSELVSLRKLNIGGNSISDISCLEKLTNLETLYLSSQHYSNPIKDVSVLRNFSNLNTLQMNSLQVSDISALGSLSLLENLEVNGTKATDFSAIKNLTKLRSLKVTGSQINDISFVETLSELQTLDLSNNRISDISSLSGLTELRNLYLSNNDIADGGDLASINKLSTIYLDKNDLTDLDFILMLPNLNVFSANYNRLFDLSTVQAFKKSLNLSKQLTFINAAIQPGKELNNPFKNKDGSYMRIEENHILRQSEDGSKLIFSENVDQLDTSIGIGVTGSGYSGRFYLNTANELLIDDQNLEDSLRATFNIYDRPLRISDLERLTSINYGNKKISNIEPIRYAYYVTSINLAGNQISDLSPLKYLTNLTGATLYANNISDISPLEALNKLTRLELYQNKIENLEPLRTLTKLDFLTLERNKITNVEPLSSLTKLTSLRLGNNTISNIEPLSSLVSLKTLSIPGNKILDFSALKNLTNLTSLSATGQSDSMSVTLINNQMENPFIDSSGNYMDVTTPTDDIELSDDKSMIIFRKFEKGKTYRLLGSSPNVDVSLTVTIDENAINFSDSNLELAIRESLNKMTGDITEDEMKSLERLDAQNRKISDLSGLEYAVNLKRLFLFGNEIEDISPLAGLDNLVELWLYSNQISDISALESLVNLKTLGLSDNKIEDISVLAHLTELNFLNLASNRVADMTPVTNLSNLSTLFLNYNRLTEIPELARMTSLERLEVTNNQISSVSRLELPALKRLYLSNNQISDISGLEGLTQLIELQFFNNQVTDIEPLKEMVNLEELWLYSNNISDIQWVESMAKLKKLGASSNRIEDISALSGLNNLTFLNLSSNKIKDFTPLVGIENIQSYSIGNQQIDIVAPKEYTNILNPLKSADGEFIPLLLTNGEMGDNNKTIILDEKPSQETLSIRFLDGDYSGVLTIAFDESLPTINASVKQESVGLGDKVISISVNDGYYETEKIILPDGTEVLGKEAFYVARKSGEYIVAVQDVAGNRFTEKIDVTVTRPAGVINQAPMIHAENVVINQGDRFEPLDYVKVTDKEDGSEKIKIEVIRNTVDSEQYGVYEVTYMATDSQGAVTIKTIQVTVNPRMSLINHAPVIEVYNQNIYIGFNLDLMSIVKAMDKEDGGVPVKVTSSDLDISKAGTYSVTYETEDSQGAISSKTIQIVVREPLVSQLGYYSESIVVTVDEKVTIDHLVKSVAEKLELTSLRIISEDVDLGEAGTYELVFSGINKEEGMETHSVKVTVKEKLTSSNEPIDDEENNKPNQNHVEEHSEGEVEELDVETGVSTTQFLGLGVFSFISGLFLLTKKRKK